ncbi:hypothetical protein [Streptomyces sp. NPDC048442]|uniref:hypothetical protein n=1 Tax=Streptomyces sp. NPDC048442 TaxID=3154823 RepID=UPI00343F7B1A
MTLSALPQPTRIPAPDRLSPRAQELLHLYARGLSPKVISAQHGFSRREARELLQRASYDLKAAAPRAGAVMFHAVLLDQVPAPPQSRLYLTDQALVFVADLVLGRTEHSMANDRSTTQGALDVLGKGVLRELGATTYAHAVYLATPTLLAIPSADLTAARSRVTTLRP